MPDTSLHWLTLSELAQRIHTGALSPLELTEMLLARLETLDGTLHAFTLVTRERALAQAHAATLALQTGQEVGPLHGIPYAAKDLFDVKGLPTTAGCTLLERNIATADAAVIRRLTHAGMILLGKTHTVQFAYGGVGINHHYGTPHNPWQAVPHAPGGSSSGSGVAVAAGLVPMALGSDTGGSVRIPAALCGTVGLKTTVGQISRAGVFPLSWTLDSIGPLTRSVEDAALVYQQLRGSDPADPSTQGIPSQDVLMRLKDGVQGLRLAFAETLFWDEVDPEISQAVRACGAVFNGLGARVDSIAFPEAVEAQECNPRGLVVAAEAYTLHQERLQAHGAQYDPIVSARMRQGQHVSAAEYLSMLRSWAPLRAKVVETLRQVDAVLVPTTMIPPLPVAEIDASEAAYSARNLQYLRNTAIGNVLNLCALSIPCGFTRQGLPIGLMIYGKPFHEDMVLRVGYAFEQATAWHRRTPDLAWVA